MLSIMELDQIVRDFAGAMEVVDHQRPQSSSNRDPARMYQPGIGPFAEDTAVALTTTEMQAHSAEYLNDSKRRYPAGGQTCDLAVGKLPDWAIEVRLARVDRDDGTYTAIKKSSRPYADDRQCRDRTGLTEIGAPGGRGSPRSPVGL
jgi:hypothetical protein